MWRCTIIKRFIVIFILLLISNCMQYHTKQLGFYSATDRIRMLCYIATDKQINNMLDYPIIKRAMVYELFWEVNDPTPLTTLNESRELYEALIEWCDEEFDGCVGEGWRSDMSKIIMLWGFPDYIYYEPMPYNSFGGYQIWEYNIKNYRLIFAERYVDCYYLQNIPIELNRWF